MLDNVGSGLLARLASEVSDLKCDFIAINDEADVQDFSENGYEVAGLEQPVDISDDDEAIVETVGQLCCKACTQSWLVVTMMTI